MSTEFFRARPPAQETRPSYPVARSSPKRWGLSFRVLCLSHGVTCAPTHHAGRTIPCLEPFAKRCPQCDAGWAPRWLGYFAAWHPQRHCKCLVELTAAAAEKFAKVAEQHGSLRGWHIKLSRLGDRPNGPLIVDGAPSGLDPEQIPTGFDVQEALLRLWKVKEHLAAADRRISPDDPRIAGDLAADAFKHNGH